MGQGWTAFDFDDSTWMRGVGGVGYDEDPDYDPHIGLDVESEMNDQNASIYIRYGFELEDASGVIAMRLGMKYDDGFIAYLNGTPVFEVNPPVEAPSWNSEAGGQHSDVEAVVFEYRDIDTFVGALRVGTNVLAIHGLNRGLASSDFLAVPELVLTRSITASQLTISDTTTIFARAYDGQNWSSPAVATFVVGEAAGPGNIAVSEIHYNPAAPSGAETFERRKEYEFIELVNVTDVPVEMRGVRLAGGAEFDFSTLSAEESKLGPGQYAVLASNEAAFRERYQVEAALSALWGTFSGALEDSGDSIVLLGADQLPIIEFSYDDKTPWPETPDGDGPSLELVNPFSMSPPAYSDATSWRASLRLHGTPGEGEAGGGFVGNPSADIDGNGITDLLDYAFGNSSSEGPDVLPTGGTELDISGVSPAHRFLLVFRRLKNAPDIVFVIERSEDLFAWRAADSEFELVDVVDHGNGSETVTYRSLAPIDDELAGFVRVQVVQQ